MSLKLIIVKAEEAKTVPEKKDVAFSSIRKACFGISIIFKDFSCLYGMIFLILLLITFREIR